MVDAIFPPSTRPWLPFLVSRFCCNRLCYAQGQPNKDANRAVKCFPRYSCSLGHTQGCINSFHGLSHQCSVGLWESTT